MNTPVAAGGTLIEARDVHKSFGQTPALRGASVAVGQGEILAIEAAVQLCRSRASQTDGSQTTRSQTDRSQTNKNT